MEIDIKLPKDWKIKNLADVCDEIFAGGDVPKNNFSKTKTNDFSIPIYANGEKNLGLYGFTNISKVNSPALTISGRGTIGFSVVRKFPFFPIVRLLVLIPNSETDVQFLKYSIDNCNIKHTGSSIPQLTVPTVKTIKIPLPPLSTQQAIVSKIEELFSELDNGIANLKTAQLQLKTYRQSVLKWAFEDLSLIKFDQVISSSQNGISKRSGTVGLNFKVLRLADITNSKIDYSSPREIIMNNQEIEKYKLFENDLICIRVNGSRDLVGKLVYVTKNNENDNWAFCDHFIRFRLNELALSKFYYHYFQTTRARKYIQDNMVASAGQNTVSQVTIKDMLVPFCDIAKQSITIQEIESRLSVADKMEESITQSLQQAEALRQSILKKAFEGKLIPEMKEVILNQKLIHGK